MKKFLKEGGLLLGTITVGLWLLLPVPLMIIVWDDQQNIDLLDRMYTHAHDRADYYFNGANVRGLLEICKDADGEIRVLWKEDCK